MTVYVAGIFKFLLPDKSLPPGADPIPGGVKENDLIILAATWLRADQNYDFLHVRKCGANQTGIEFRYRLKEGETLKNFTMRMTHELKRQFGNNLVAWDIATAMVIR